MQVNPMFAMWFFTAITTKVVFIIILYIVMRDEHREYFDKLEGKIRRFLRGKRKQALQSIIWLFRRR